MGERAKHARVMGNPLALYFNTSCLFMVGDASQHTSKSQLQHRETGALSVLVFHRYIRTRTCYMGSMATTHVGTGTKEGD
jgi:hypothetical protein